MAQLKSPPPASLSQKAAAGTAWSTLSTVGRQLLSIASMATVARILGPGVYGVMGMANLLLVVVVNFRDLGTGTAIIQRLSIVHRLLASLFWLNCLMGVFMALAVIAASRLTAQFFHTPELVPILCTISISFVLSAFGIVHNSLLLREMRFKALAVADLSSALASYIVALICANKGLGVWSLVYANIANSVTSTSLYWLASAWRPTWEFSLSEVKSVMGFSLNLFGFGLANYGYRNADNVIIGRVIGRVPLGNYQMAYNLMLLPLQNISSVIAQVVFPAFSQIQEDNERFRVAWVRSVCIVALFTFPVMAGLGILADPFIRGILGSKWIGAIPIFEVLAPVGAVQSIQTLVGAIYMAKGRTDWMFRWGLLNCAVLIPAFLIGVHFGAFGVAVAYCAAYFIVLAYYGFAIPFRFIELRFRDFATALLPQILLTLGMTAICYIWIRLMLIASISNPWIEIASTALLGTALYITGLFVFRPAVIHYLRGMIAESQNQTVIRVASLCRIRS